MNGCMQSEGTDLPCVPLPMVCVAFVFGAILGAVVGHKREMMAQGGWGGKPWMHRGMRGHHHHGEGSPACREWHGDWPNPQMPPAEETSQQ